MLSPSLDTIRLFLHVLAAALWAGGQLTLAGLVPALRGAAEGAPRVAARAFARIAWPSYAVLVVTGVWNLYDVDFLDAGTEYQVTVFVKLLVVAASGVAAAVHAAARSRTALAAWGSVAGLTSLLAFFLGILLRTGS